MGSERGAAQPVLGPGPLESQGEHSRPHLGTAVPSQGLSSASTLAGGTLGKRSASPQVGTGEHTAHLCPAGKVWGR